MNNSENGIDKELFLEKFEKLSLQIEKLSSEITALKSTQKGNRSFGLKALENSEALNFTKDVVGAASPTKRYLLSIRTVDEKWKGRRDDVIIAIRQQDLKSHNDVKALGIRIPINDTKNLRILAREIISLLYVSCELQGLEITEMLRDILGEINQEGPNLINEIRTKMRL